MPDFSISIFISCIPPQAVTFLSLYSCANIINQNKSICLKNLYCKIWVKLTAQIPLPNVSGRIDHLAYDSLNHLAFIAALGNNTIEVVNIDTKQVVQTIKGFDIDTDLNMEQKIL